MVKKIDNSVEAAIERFMKRKCCKDVDFDNFMERVDSGMKIIGQRLNPPQSIVMSAITLSQMRDFKADVEEKRLAGLDTREQAVGYIKRLCEEFDLYIDDIFDI